MDDRLVKLFWKRIPKTTCMMCERSVGSFEEEETGALQSDSIRGTSASVGWATGTIVEMGWLVKLGLLVGDLRKFGSLSILSHCEDLRAGGIWVNLGVSETARAAQMRLDLKR